MRDKTPVVGVTLAYPCVHVAFVKEITRFARNHPERLWEVEQQTLETRLLSLVLV